MSWSSKVSAVFFSVLVLLLVDGFMSLIGLFPIVVCPLRLLMILQYCWLSVGFGASGICKLVSVVGFDSCSHNISILF